MEELLLTRAAENALSCFAEGVLPNCEVSRGGVKLAQRRLVRGEGCYGSSRTREAHLSHSLAHSFVMHEVQNLVCLRFKGVWELRQQHLWGGIRECREGVEELQTLQFRASRFERSGFVH